MFAKQGLLFACFVAMAVGCNQQNASPVSDANSNSTDQTQEVVATNTADASTNFATLTQDPKATAEIFLTALKEGDRVKTSQLLTNKAKEETLKHQLVVSPPGYQTANFVVGGVVYLTSEKNGAHVESHWVDTNPTGQQKSYEIIWIMRKQSNGWRVAGMATELFAGEPPLVLNFEDPEDFMRQQMLAEQELTRRTNSTDNTKIQQAGFNK